MSDEAIERLLKAEPRLREELRLDDEGVEWQVKELEKLHRLPSGDWRLEAIWEAAENNG